MIEKDDMPKYLLFLENTFPYMQKYDYKKGMKALLQELKYLLKSKDIGTDSDRALLLDFQATLETKPEKGISVLQKLSKGIKEYNSDCCLDYATVQETLGNIYLITADLSQAKTHFKRALKIYETVWSEEPELIERKYQEIQELYPQVGVALAQNFKRLNQ